jgi:hypothetical protein
MPQTALSRPARQDIGIPPARRAAEAVTCSHPARRDACRPGQGRGGQPAALVSYPIPASDRASPQSRQARSPTISPSRTVTTSYARSSPRSRRP